MKKDHNYFMKKAFEEANYAFYKDEYWSKIDTIVYAASDKKRGFSSYNLEIDREIKTISGIMESESKDLLDKFFKKIRD